MNTAFAAFIDAADRIKGKAQEIYECGGCATISKAAPGCCVTHRRLEKPGPDSTQSSIDAMLAAATTALSAAHAVGIDYGQAETRIGSLADESRRILQWAWQHAGAGAWLNQRPGEDEEAYCERCADVPLRSVARQIEAEWNAMQQAFDQACSGCWRMWHVAIKNDSSEKVPAPPLSPEREQKQILEPMAMALLLTIGPNAKQIAQKVGVPRTTLLSWPTFKAAYDKKKAEAATEKEKRRQRLRTADQDDDK